MLRVAARQLPTQVTLDLLHASCAYTLGKYDEAAQSLREYLNPDLEGRALAPFKANLSDAAFYLHTLLNRQQNITLPAPTGSSRAARLFTRYASGEASRKEVLDHAGRAETTEAARKQICSAAYWLAQLEKTRGNPGATQELLKIALSTGSAENPEWQFARWQTAQADWFERNTTPVGKTEDRHPGATRPIAALRK